MRLEPEALVVGQIDIGDACVGSYVLEGDSRIGGAYLDGLSSLAQGQQVPAGERWEGAPARRSAQPIRHGHPATRPGLPMRRGGGRLCAGGALAVAALFFLPVFPPLS